MQLTHSQSNLVEKIVRDKNGRLVRATFCVYENGASIKARLVSAVFLEETPAIENKILQLSVCIQKSAEQCIDIVQSAFTSPFIPAVLYISGSKPRAPTK